eukprot:TRINITY_DN58049_c0_g1_i2.p1 TRINITY_DN58049_c0_g1~~TRINITY_DN58049_c0_g1_i2.p1  ORF type:complete len:684 (-),score=128.80 TRINITY_DN58049_c0_g1_i2:8-2059(-)
MSNAFAALADSDEEVERPPVRGPALLSGEFIQKGARTMNSTPPKASGYLVAAAPAPAPPADVEGSDSDEEQDESAEGEGYASDTSDVTAWRQDRGVHIDARSSHAAAAESSYEPVLRFSTLLERGVPESLVERCRKSAGGALRPTAIQAECWGLLILAGEGATPSSSSTSRPKGESYVDVPVPDDSDSDLDESAQKGAAICPSPCRVREAVDVVGIAPTGSGKTLAFMLPLLADGLCLLPAGGGAASTTQGLFSRFQELFPHSFSLDTAGNKALFDRCLRLEAQGEVTALQGVISQVAAKAEICAKTKALAASWRSLRVDCSSKGLATPLAIVLSPTRELALQVAAVAEACGASSAAVIGGVEPEQQRAMLLRDRPSLLIATPGRLRALCGELPSSFRQRYGKRPDAKDGGGALDDAIAPLAVVSLDCVARLVMDEGDRLLDEGFTEDVGALVKRACNRRQAMLFSATWSSETESLAAVLRSDVVHVSVAGIPGTISQYVELVPKAARARRLRELLREFGKSKTVVFVLFKKEAKELAKMLSIDGFLADALQGDMSQAARSAALQRFRDTESGVLVATDVAARGLDVGGVKHVVNFSLGLSMDSYVHRIGRCGRAGRQGTAVTFVTDGDERHAGPLMGLLKQYGQPVPPGLAGLASAFERNGGHHQVKPDMTRRERKLASLVR